jgi:hypothetical protein
VVVRDDLAAWQRLDVCAFTGPSTASCAASSGIREDAGRLRSMKPEVLGAGDVTGARMTQSARRPA